MQRTSGFFALHTVPLPALTSIVEGETKKEPVNSPLQETCTVSQRQADFHAHAGKFSVRHMKWQVIIWCKRGQHGWSNPVNKAKKE